jgi:formamidopyrimidine-DNA glycosylase
VPELPDVEGFRRYFARYAAGRRVEKVEVLDRSLLRNTTPQGLGRALRGRRLARPERHGKWLLVPTEGATLLVHFGMTGELRWTSGSKSRHPHDRVVLDLEGGELRYRNMRKFGGVWLGRTARDAWRIMGRPGPDALAVDRDAFLELLAGRRGAIKPALMDQKLIAGIGNELSDEILWQARLHPRRAIPNLATREQDQLFDALHDVLRESVRRGRIPRRPGWLTAVRAERDPACPRCGSRLERARVGGRTAYWCPRCQRARRGGRRRDGSSP